MSEPNQIVDEQEYSKVFPFTAIVGQEEMKLSLILNMIEPGIGGVLIMGDRGTGKSTTIRAMADLLPKIKCIKTDLYNSHPEYPELMVADVRKNYHELQKENSDFETKEIKTPMIDLPLGATEDRVCGTIDIEKALLQGTKAFEPGLLAKANRGILYVDEVNLLDDHLVDILLDSAASGWNTVEREGISIRHPARFILIGSGNPEEGELRPQLLDRFGMHAVINTVREPHLRVEIVEGRTQFDKDPDFWIQNYKTKQKELAKIIVEAKENVSNVEISDDFKIKLSNVCSDLRVDGLRGDIVCTRAAKAHAAFAGRTSVEETDIAETIVLCLRHRLKKDPLAKIDSGEKVREVVISIFGEIFDSERNEPIMV